MQNAGSGRCIIKVKGRIIMAEHISAEKLAEIGKIEYEKLQKKMGIMLLLMTQLQIFCNIHLHL